MAAPLFGSRADCRSCGAPIQAHEHAGRPRAQCVACRPPAGSRPKRIRGGPRPTCPCAMCGKSMLLSPGSLPEGKAMCHPCRRIRRTLPTPPPAPHGSCAICAGPLVGKGQRKFCSSRCSIRMLRPCITVEERQAQSRARWRRRNHLKRAQRRLADVSTAYEKALRSRVKSCPLCWVALVEEPFTPASKELDHIVPMNAGGTHTIGNVRIICRLCNQRRPLDGSDYVGPVTLWSVAS